MEKPKVYANPINKKINNSQELFYDSNKSEVRSDYSKDIIKRIDEIFNSANHVYKSKVSITTTNTGNLVCDIVGKTNNNLLTLDGNKIKISEILDIKKI